MPGRAFIRRRVGPSRPFLFYHPFDSGRVLGAGRGQAPRASVDSIRYFAMTLLLFGGAQMPLQRPGSRPGGLYAGPPRP